MSMSVPILMPFLFLTHFSFKYPVRQRRRSAHLLPSRFGITLADERTLNITESYGDLSKSNLCPV